MPTDLLSARRVPVLTQLPATRRTRKTAPAARTQLVARKAAYRERLAQTATSLQTTAQKYVHAGNLEMALATHLDLCLALEHLNAAPGRASAPAAAATASQLATTYGVLQQLHEQLQSKKSYYHGCLDSASDDDGDEHDETAAATSAGHVSSSSSASLALKRRALALACKHVVPLADTQVTMDAIVGNAHLKREILNGVVQPFLQPLLFKVRRSFLFYGPPGTGKTLFAKAAAHSLDRMSSSLQVIFFAPTTDALKDKYVGGTERKITSYFQCAQRLAEAKAAETGTDTLSIIFIDEIDSLAGSRERDDSSGTTASATNTLLQMMDGFTALPNVVVMAATNYPWHLDSAILSRFQEKIHVALPDLDTVHALLRHHLTRFYMDTLGIDEATDPLAKAHTGVDPAPQRYALLAHVFGVSDQQLLLVAQKLHSPLTYSPSNIKDVCHQVFRKNARVAHEQGVFHEIRVRTDVRAYATQTQLVQHLLLQMDGKYAAATTYARLRKRFQAVVEKTLPVTVHPEDGGKTAAHAPTRPDSLRLKGVEYVHCALWKPLPRRGHVANRGAPDARLNLDVAARALQQLDPYHVYLRRAPVAEEDAVLHVVLFRRIHAAVGTGSHLERRPLATYARAELSATDTATIARYAREGVLGIQRFLERRLFRSPNQILWDAVREVWFEYADERSGIASEEERPGETYTDTDTDADADADTDADTDTDADGHTLHSQGKRAWHFEFPTAPLTKAPAKPRTTTEKPAAHPFTTATPTATPPRISTRFMLEGTADRPVPLSSFPWGNVDGPTRYAWWLVGVPTRQRPKAIPSRIDLRRAPSPVDPRHGTAQAWGMRRLQAIEQKAFALYLNVDLFADAVDTERNPVAVLPSSSKKEVARFEAYAKGSVVK